ncbi:MAG: polysaccharide biosynthesis protein [Phycisphaerae bacterium]|nr:polysaccharide biosynthesis protein [Phycisphaerae bacterium]
MLSPMFQPSIVGAGVGVSELILVGTEETVRSLRAQLAAAAPELRPGGCVLVRRHGSAAGLTCDPGLPVLGWTDELVAVAARCGVRWAIVSLPGAMSAALARARALLKQAGVSERLVPPLTELLAAGVGGVGGAAVAPGRSALDPAELIARTPHGLDRRAVGRILTGKRVLITGAGGSIGSELSRLAAEFRPELLILVERSENALFEIDRQVASRFPDVPRRAVLHDVVDGRSTRDLLTSLRPHTVFHAAAHKHVPLMEDHPSHAVSNNVFGTRSIADAAAACGAERFVMISSDKAVNPTSVMGATKRLAEIYVRARAGASATRMSMVRFGNVLGSACSVLPIWSSQLSEGGPVTVTDPRMTRYFMTIHEAALLVLQAAAMADAGAATGALNAGPRLTLAGGASPSRPDASAPVYVLDMGEPVRILDLAVRFVRAHGLEARVPGTPAPDPSRAAADIVFTGARPGEKLHEELAYAAENLAPTAHPGIHAWAGDGPDERARTERADEMIAALSEVRARPEAPVPDRDAVLAVLRRYVPEMQSGTGTERARSGADAGGPPRLAIAG